MFSLKNKNPKIVIQVNDSPYIEKLIEVLSYREDETPVLLIKSKYDNSIGAVELLIEIQYFIQKLTSLYLITMKLISPNPRIYPQEG
ncbi:MAG: hypothetical protein WCF67_08710 [Chitinophagaceae bacterium]